MIRTVEHELDSLLRIFKDLIAETDLKHDFDNPDIDMKEALTFFLQNALGKNAKQFLQDLDPRHFQQLMVALVLTLKQNDIALKNLPALNALATKLENIMKKLSLTPGIKPSPEEVRKLKAEFAKILESTDDAALKADLTKLFTTILLTLEAAKLYQPKPDSSAKQDAKEMVEAHANARYSNLLGMAANITGAIPVTISSYMGNGLGFPDFDPYNGLNPMARQNDPYDANIDSFNQVAVIDAISNGVSNIADEFKEKVLIHANALQPGVY